MEAIFQMRSLFLCLPILHVAFIGDFDKKHGNIILDNNKSTLDTNVTAGQHDMSKYL